MANRVLRDWTASESIDLLSEGAEIFFTRLIMKADDFGCFHGNPKLLNSALFPLRNYPLSKIIAWRAECAKAKVIVCYTCDGKEFVKIENFGQRLRLMSSKFPQPSDSNSPSNVSGAPSTDNIQPPELETKRNEVEDETETKGNAADCGEVTVWPTFEDFWNSYDKKQDRPKTEKKWNTINQGAREKIMQHLELYIRGTPDKHYRKNPLTYLNNNSWENEIITEKPKHGLTAQATLDRLNSYTN